MNSNEKKGWFWFDQKLWVGFEKHPFLYYIFDFV